MRHHTSFFYFRHIRAYLISWLRFSEVCFRIFQQFNGFISNTLRCKEARLGRLIAAS